MNSLPDELLQLIGRYLLTKDLVRLQTVLQRRIETHNILRLRFRHEPYKHRSLSCTYHKGCFKVEWNTHKHMLTVYDRTSNSNREAVRKLGELLLTNFY